MSEEIVYEVSVEGFGGTLPMVEYNAHDPGQPGLRNKQLTIDARGDRVSFYIEEYNYDTNRRRITSLTLPRNIWDHLKSLVKEGNGEL